MSADNNLPADMASGFIDAFKSKLKTYLQLAIDFDASFFSGLASVSMSLLPVGVGSFILTLHSSAFVLLCFLSPQAANCVALLLSTLYSFLPPPLFSFRHPSDGPLATGNNSSGAPSLTY